jgi:sulfate transport system ATP-binding protein
VAGASFAAPEHVQASASALGYVRPHEMEITPANHLEQDAVRAKVAYVHGLGPVVNLELTRVDTGETLHAQLSRRKFDSLAASVGDLVHVRPNAVRVIAEDYSI